MRYLLFAMLISSNCYATEYKFTFNMKDGRQLKVKWEASNRWEALEKAGVFCGKFFGVKPGISEEKLEDILDTCANPSFN